jgi:hypothetical protein
MVEGSGPIANQRVNTSVSVKDSDGAFHTLPQGSFVKYVSKIYLPRDHGFGEYQEDVQVTVYSQYGIVLVARHCLDWNVY